MPATCANYSSWSLLAIAKSTAIAELSSLFAEMITMQHICPINVMLNSG
jgi:hypothetical protein